MIDLCTNLALGIGFLTMGIAALVLFIDYRVTKYKKNLDNYRHVIDTNPGV